KAAHAERRALPCAVEIECANVIVIRHPPPNHRLTFANGRRERAVLKSDQASAASSSPDLGAVPLYSCNLLRSVRMLTSSNLAAWVRLPLQRSSAAKICCFSNSPSVGNLPELLNAPGVAPMSAGAGASVELELMLVTRPRCSGSNMPVPPHMITARSTTFCSSRTLPGHECSLSVRSAASVKP